MKTKHTQGEWHINSTGVFNKDGKLIANCVSDGIHFTEEDKANAKLIAAAPNLLKACIKALKEIQNPKRDGTLAEEDLINAIKKATEI